MKKKLYVYHCNFGMSVVAATNETSARRIAIQEVGPDVQ